MPGTDFMPENNDAFDKLFDPATPIETVIASGNPIAISLRLEKLNKTWGDGSNDVIAMVKRSPKVIPTILPVLFEESLSHHALSSNERAVRRLVAIAQVARADERREIVQRLIRVAVRIAEEQLFGSQATYGEQLFLGNSHEPYAAVMTGLQDLNKQMDIFAELDHAWYQRTKKLEDNPKTLTHEAALAYDTPFGMVATDATRRLIATESGMQTVGGELFQRRLFTELWQQIILDDGKNPPHQQVRIRLIEILTDMYKLGVRFDIGGMSHDLAAGRLAEQARRGGFHSDDAAPGTEIRNELEILSSLELLAAIMPRCENPNSALIDVVAILKDDDRFENNHEKAINVILAAIEAGVAGTQTLDDLVDIASWDKSRGTKKQQHALKCIREWAERNPEQIRPDLVDDILLIAVESGKQELRLHALETLQAFARADIDLSSTVDGLQKICYTEFGCATIGRDEAVNLKIQSEAFGVLAAIGKQGGDITEQALYAAATLVNTDDVMQGAITSARIHVLSLRAAAHETYTTAISQFRFGNSDHELIASSVFKCMKKEGTDRNITDETRDPLQTQLAENPNVSSEVLAALLTQSPSKRVQELARTALRYQSNAVTDLSRTMNLGLALGTVAPFDMA